MCTVRAWRDRWRELAHRTVAIYGPDVPTLPTDSPHWNPTQSYKLHAKLTGFGLRGGYLVALTAGIWPAPWPYGIAAEDGEVTS